MLASPRLSTEEDPTWTSLQGFTEIEIAALLKSKTTIAAVDKLMGHIWGHYSGAPGEDGLANAINNAAIARRQELRDLAQAGVAKRLARRFPPPLPSISKTLPEKRVAAGRRRELADFLVHQVPLAFIERLPKCSSARAVLAVICRLSARSRNRCDASINTIAEMAGVSRSSVNQSLKLLTELRLIWIDSGRLRGTVSVIRVLASPLEKLVAYCRNRLRGWKRYRSENAPEQLSLWNGPPLSPASVRMLSCAKKKGTS
uniref:hypothetical protein n=1 Tax=Brucella pseudintermedia TaxID=370111 RepID=UPI001AEE8A6F